MQSSKSTDLHNSNLDVAAVVKQAQLMRNQAIAEMVSAGWQGARRIATKLVNTSRSNGHGVTAPATDR